MYDNKMYEIAYVLKEDQKGISSMNDLCTNIENQVNVEDIVDLMKLYSDRAVNGEQNEFVTEVINLAVLIEPKLASDIIINELKYEIKNDYDELYNDFLNRYYALKV